LEKDQETTIKIENIQNDNNSIYTLSISCLHFEKCIDLKLIRFPLCLYLCSYTVCTFKNVIALKCKQLGVKRDTMQECTSRFLSTTRALMLTLVITIQIISTASEERKYYSFLSYALFTFEQKNLSYFFYSSNLNSRRTQSQLVSNCLIENCVQNIRKFGLFLRILCYIDN
jgi:hypothetical protein